MTNSEQVSHVHESKKFSIVKRAESFTHAGRGIYIFLRSTHNAWVHIVAFVVVVIAGIYFNISHSDWINLIIVSGLVFITEAINTAIEIDIDLTSPNFHPYAKDTKDVAAGAVLISAIVAIVVGILIFAPYIL
jgi:diacylglycerol kinase (ATP)